MVEFFCRKLIQASGALSGGIIICVQLIFLAISFSAFLSL